MYDPFCNFSHFYLYFTTSVATIFDPLKKSDESFKLQLLPILLLTCYVHAALSFTIKVLYSLTNVQVLNYLIAK